MEIAQLVFLILIWVWLVGIFGKLSDTHNMIKGYLEVRLNEMKMFYGNEGNDRKD